MQLNVPALKSYSLKFIFGHYSTIEITVLHKGGHANVCARPSNSVVATRLVAADVSQCHAA